MSPINPFKINPFRGGVHLRYNKLTRNDEIETAPLPKKVILPLQQHSGSPCKPVVAIGDSVRVGQKIAHSESFVSAPIHSSISGRVLDIAKSKHPVLGDCDAVIIKSDGKKALDDSDFRRRREGIEGLGKEELKNIIRDCGIVGLGGAAFPTHVKLSPPPEKRIDTLILNGAECEPYLTCDHRIMLEQTEKVIKGVQIIIRILEPKECYIAVEENKENTIPLFEKMLLSMALHTIKVVRLKTIYPHGAEKNLIYSVTKRIVPKGGLPMDAGVVVQNVQTAKAIYDAVYECSPLIERVITVTGAVKEPKNLLVRIGTPVKELIEFCGGYEGSAGKLILGGPMMGIAQYSDEVPVIKGTSGILVQKEKVIGEEERDCIRCGRCIDSCPMDLMPTLIAQYSQKEEFERCEEYSALDCYECGCCSYACPSKIPLVHWIKHAKKEIISGKPKK